MRYTDKEVASYTVDGEERVVVERTFTDGTIHHFFMREVDCDNCSGGEVVVDLGGYTSASTEPNLRAETCPACLGTMRCDEEVPCDLAGNDEDSDLYLPYVNAKSECSMLDLLMDNSDQVRMTCSNTWNVDPSDLSMDSLG